MTEAQVRRRLANRGYDSDQIEEALDRFADDEHDRLRDEALQQENHDAHQE